MGCWCLRQRLSLLHHSASQPHEWTFKRPGRWRRNGGGHHVLPSRGREPPTPGLKEAGESRWGHWPELWPWGEGCSHQSFPASGQRPKPSGATGPRGLGDPAGTCGPLGVQVRGESGPARPPPREASMGLQGVICASFNLKETNVCFPGCALGGAVGEGRVAGNLQDRHAGGLVDARPGTQLSQVGSGHRGRPHCCPWVGVGRSGW